MTQQRQPTKTIPFRGGCTTNKETSAIPSGGYSMKQNTRDRHPGFEKRLGCRALHTTADMATSLVDAAASTFTGTTGSWTGYGSNTVSVVSNALTITYTDDANGAYLYLADSTDLTRNLVVGERYRIVCDAKYTGGAAGPYLFVNTGLNFGTLTTTLTTYTGDFTATSTTTNVFYTPGMSAGNVVTIDNFYLYVVGEVVSLFQFSKGRVAEKHTYAQMGDGDVLEATANPPTVTTGAFGSEVFSGSGGQLPASWSVLDDRMVYSNGVDQHQIYPGSDQYVKRAVLVSASSAVPTIPDTGSDYSEQVTDGLTTTVLPLDSLQPAGEAVTLFSDNADSLSTSTTSIMTNTGENAAEWSYALYGGSATVVGGGEAGNCISLANAGAAAGKMVLLAGVATAIGTTYKMTFYFKAGTSASGWGGIASSLSATPDLAKTGNLSDAGWTAYSLIFVATSTTSYPVFGNTSVTAGHTSLFDTISVVSYESNGNWVNGQYAAIIPMSPGSTTNGYQLTNALTGIAGKMYHDVTTAKGMSCTLTFYFKVGTSVSGRVYVGTAADEDALGDSTALTDADWTQKTISFVATGVSTRITILNTSTVQGQTSLFDTFVFNNTIYNYLYIKTDIPANALKFTVGATNTSNAVMLVKYWNGAWTTTGMTDGTIASAGKTLGQTGSMAWTLKTDEYPYYMFDEAGFWYQLSLSSGVLDSEVEISSIQYNTTWQGIQNVWDGVPATPVEIAFYDQSATAYLTYSADSVTVSQMTASDIVYISSADPIVGFYVDVGATPNTTAATVVNAVNYFNGVTMATVGTIYDGTAGLSKSGWVTFGRQTDVQPRQFNNSNNFTYWYSFTVDKTLSASLTVSITCMPYFRISEFGYEGLCSAAWQDRMLYTFPRYPHDIAVSSKHAPMVLNGDDFTFLERPADGRSNRVICMKRFKNDLLVWQEERGVDGGSLTKYVYNATLANITKSILSTYYGTFSAKSAVVVGGIRMNIDQSADEPVTVAFFLSHYGVFATDGTTILCISDHAHSSIQNYFDPAKTECIRAGYESKMWLAYDPGYHCVRLGLVSGSSATLPNIFPVYDIQDRTWSFDSLGQEFACLTTVEAGSGNVTAVQIAGGIDDGLVYQSNYGANDVSTAIDCYATQEIDYEGRHFCLDEVQLRMKVQSAGNCTLTPYQNGIAQTAKTLSMTAEVTNQVSRRHRVPTNWISDHISLKYQNATVDQSIYLKDVNIGIKELGEQ